MFDIKLSRHLAELSKISFTEAELLKITDEMNEIVALMDTLADFSTDGVLTQRLSVGLEQIREDKACDSSPRSEILKNAAKRQENAFAVPKVV